MGLDMYLYAKKEIYKSNFCYRVGDKPTLKYPKAFKNFKIPQNNQSKLVIERYQIGYWRKANAIHSWFVENCGDGIDNCQPIEVEKDKLIELSNICKAVLKDHSKANDLLPTQEGFFFGSVEYDNYYFDDVKKTLDIITPAIELIGSSQGKDYTIEYQASW